MLFFHKESYTLRPFAALLLAAALFAVALQRPAAAQPADALGEVVRQAGVVTAVHDGTRRALHIGAAVRRGDQIFTGADSKVAIRFADGSTLAVGADTRVEVSEYARDAQGRGLRGVLTLAVGIVRTSLSGLWSGGFEVRTRAAVAAVRSTDWITDAAADGSAVFVVEGVVAVTGTAEGSTVVLRQGDGTDVKLGAAPTPPKQWGPPRVQGVIDRTTVP